MATKPSEDVAEPCSDLTAFQIDALAAVARLGRPHGLAIKDELEERYETVHHGRLYPNLDTLVVKGLVEKGEVDKRTNYYTLSSKGASELNGYTEWLAGCMDSSENEGKELVTDGGVDGAIDNDWDESELSTEASMLAAIEDLDHELSAGDVAIDLVTRQPLYLHEQVADDLAEYKDENDFDLFSYKSHPYLPVRLDDRVFECVFVTHEPSQAHNSGKTYDYPEGRLMKIPLSEAWDDE